MTLLEDILLLGLIVTAVAAPLCKRLMATVIVYMSFGLLMAVGTAGVAGSCRDGGRCGCGSDHDFVLPDPAADP